VVSARVFEDAGFPAVVTSSAALSVSLGYPDGETIQKEELFAAVRRIAGRLNVPLSADIESGFGATIPELVDTVRRVIEAGAVGVNIEDIANYEKNTLYSLEAQVERLHAVRKASDSLGIQLVINARSDAYRYSAGDEEARFQEVIQRERAYEDAGADCLYPMGLTDKKRIASFVKSVTKPVNVMARKGIPTIAELESIGVRRLSLGPGPIYATTALLRKIAQELREKGSYETMLTGAITFDELNALARPITQ
jgi:2-methylisocitrate lyase-like PEP mutase family enzyme